MVQGEQRELKIESVPITESCNVCREEDQMMVTTMARVVVVALLIGTVAAALC